MTAVRRLTLFSAFLSLIALLATARVWGEPGKTKNNKLADRNEPVPAQVQKNLIDDLAHTKFSGKNVVTYQTKDGSTLFGLQVQPKLDAVAARPRDLLVMVDTSAGQVRSPIIAARQMTEAIAKAAGPSDRIALWTINTPAATHNLTRGFVKPGSAAVQDALKVLQREVPLGAVALNTGLSKALASFKLEEGRQRAVVFLGNGMSVAEAFTNADRTKLCQKLVDSEVAVFPIPIGPIEKLRQGSYNLHGLATGTGGLVVRSLPGEKLEEVVRKLNESLAAPILYTQKFQPPAEVVEYFPKKLPPLRGDAPTLVLGKIKAAEKLGYTVEGTIAGKKVKVRMSEDVGTAELENFFLVSALGQWERATDKEAPALVRADRALAMAFEQNRLNRDELIGQAQWAIEQDQLGAAEDLLKRARDLDPRDPEIDAGLRIIEKLRTKQLTKRQLKDALVRADDDLVTKIEKKKIQRGRFDKLVAQAEPKKDAPERIQPDFNNPRDRDDMLRLQKQRMAVEEQRITQIVNDIERQARRLLQSDPDAAHDLLRRNLANIRENPDLGPQVKQNLLNRMETALRNVDTQGVRIKRDLEDRMRLMADAQRRLALAEEQVRGEEQIRRRLQAFSMLMNQWRFNEAYKEALILQQDTVARGAPINPTMVAAYYMGLTADHLREVQEVRRASEERYLLTMLQVEKSHIPFPDEPPVQFPPAATWRELTKLRKGVWDYTGLGEDDSAREAVRRLEKRLSQKVNLNEGIPPNTALKEALDFLSDRYELTFIIDSNAFTAVGLQKVEEQPVSLPKMIGVSLATVLRLLLGQVKGEPYSGTYLIRRDFIEITTTYHAAAEKVVRAYPVSDLVIPIPNAVNQQALQQSLNVYGQFLSRSPFMNGFGMMGMMGMRMGMMGGMMGMGNGGIAGAQQFNPMFNAFQMQGGLPGNNQFGNLGGQFGMQGRDYSRQLLQLVTSVVAPREWSKFVDPNQQVGQGGLGQIPAAAAEPDPNDGPLSPDKPELLNQIGYYRPTRSLVVRASSRIHTRLGGGLTRGPGGGGMGMAPAANRDGALVIKPRDPGDPRVAGLGAKRGNETDPKAKPNVNAKPPTKLAEVDARKVWEETLTKCLQKGKGNFDSGLIIATADFLVQAEKYDHAAEFLKASIRLGLVDEPWAFESLAIALQLSGGSPEEIERAHMSVVDLQPQDAQGFLKAAQAMAGQKRYGTAVAFCRQSALLDPNQSQVYSDALLFAEMAGDGESVSWAAGNLLRRDWPIENVSIHARAQERLAEFAKSLEKRQPADATRLLNQLNRSRERDLVINLTFQGQAALDLKVREPIGTVCSFQQRQTPGGGTLVGDNLSDLSRQSYAAAQAFSGDYEVSVERVWGRPTGAKATIEVIWHQGTDRETRELHTLAIDAAKGPAAIKLKLTEGRRKSVAAVPPPAQRPERAVDEQTSADRVLNKLRSLTDPNLTVNESGMRGGFRTTGRSARVATVDALSQGKDKKGPAPLEGVSYQTRLSVSVPNSLDMMVKSVVSPDQKEMRIKLNPVFQTARRGSSAATSSILPGDDH